MVDISAIGAVATSLNTAVNIAKAMIDVRDATAFQGKVFELQRAIIDAQQSVFAANEERSTLIQKVGQLEKHISELEAWAAEKQRYELIQIAPGLVAYAVKDGMRGFEPFHYLCANCYTAGKKSYLQQHIRGPLVDRYKCNACGEEITNNKGQGPNPSIPWVRY
jgi:hypothetical protein